MRLVDFADTYLRRVANRRAANRHPATHRQAANGRSPGVAPDRVDDDINAASFQLFFHDRFEVFMHPVYNAVSADSLEVCCFFLTTGYGKDVSTQASGELHGGAAHAASGSQN